MPETTREERARFLAEQERNAEIDRKLREAVAARKAKYPDDAKAQAKPKPKTKQKPRGFKAGGKVRGCGKARKGVRKAKMR